jgi:sulfur-carrier protein adenylyltransferase/sulfurtransferase
MQVGPLVEPAPDLGGPERERYARHTRLPEVGEIGQRRLRAARVLVVGAGGLGSPALTYLAAAGVGTIGIVDDDHVEVSNLHRQPLHGEADLGRPKVESAADRLADLNPHVTVHLHRRRFTAASASELVGAYDVVLDGADNFATRYLVGDACALAGIPHVWASVHTFAGQLSVWWAGRGPCYRCVFPEAPPPGSVASCAETGVLGVVPGVMGTLQAAEALKLITGIGDVAVGRIVLHDALAGTWDVLSVAARPDCALCGREPTITQVLDQVPPAPPAGPAIASDALVGLLGRPGTVVLDVREPGELSEGRIEPSVHIPMGEVLAGAADDRLATWREQGDRVVVLCRTGVRSARVVAHLVAAGVARAQSLDGGLVAWQAGGHRGGSPEA